MKKISPPSNADDNLITVKPGQARPLSPHHRVIQAVGEDLIRQSLVNGQEFCKFMISACTGAIPVYIALLTLAIPAQKATGGYTVIVTVPPLLYLTAMILFAAGYRPAAGQFSLDVIDEIEAYREKTIRKLITCIKVGFSFFVLATLLASVVIITGLGTK